MINLRMDKNSELTFKLNIEGTEKSPECKLHIDLKDNQELHIKGFVKNDEVLVKVPPLTSFKENLPSNIVKAKLEVYIEENYFVPWEDEITLQQLVSVKAEAIQPHVAEEKPLKEKTSISVQVQSRIIEDMEEVEDLIGSELEDDSHLVFEKQEDEMIKERNKKVLEIINEKPKAKTIKTLSDDLMKEYLKSNLSFDEFVKRKL